MSYSFMALKSIRAVSRESVFFHNRYLFHYHYSVSLKSWQNKTGKKGMQGWICYLDLHLEVRLEVGEQSEENGEWEFEDLRHRRDTILGQGHTQVLLDGVDEHLVSLEDGPGVLQDGQEQLEGQDLRSQLMGPEAEEEKRRKFKQCSYVCKDSIQYSFVGKNIKTIYVKSGERFCWNAKFIVCYIDIYI